MAEKKSKASRRKDIADLLNLITEEYGYEPVVGEVESVNEENHTCNVIDLNNDETIYNVRLSPDSNIDNYQVPAVNSKVIVDYYNRQVPYVAMFSQLDKQIIQKAVYKTSENEDLKIFIKDMLESILRLQLQHPQGPTITPQAVNSAQSTAPIQTGVINASEFSDLLKRLDNIFK